MHHITEVSHNIPNDHQIIEVRVNILTDHQRTCRVVSHKIFTYLQITEDSHNIFTDHQIIEGRHIILAGRHIIVVSHNILTDHQITEVSHKIITFQNITEVSHNILTEVSHKILTDHLINRGQSKHPHLSPHHKDHAVPKSSMITIFLNDQQITKSQSKYPPHEIHITSIISDIIFQRSRITISQLGFVFCNKCYFSKYKLYLFFPNISKTKSITIFSVGGILFIFEKFCSFMQVKTTFGHLYFEKNTIQLYFCFIFRKEDTKFNETKSRISWNLAENPTPHTGHQIA